MAAHVLRLRLALLLGALRGDAVHATRVVASLLLLVVAVVVACAGVLSLRDAPTSVVLVVSVLCGSAVTLGFALAPMLAGAVDPLDPRRFAVLPVAPAPLAGLLAAAGLLSVPILALAAVGICLVVVWAAQGVAWPLAVLGLLLGILTCALMARVALALTALVLRERRSRELAGLFAVAVLVIGIPVAVFFASLEWRRAVPDELADAISVLALTPFGAAWAFPARIAHDPSSAIASLTVAVLTLALLAVGWMLLVRRLLSTTERPGSGGGQGGLGWFALTPGTPGGAVAARSLVYWLRDRRHLVNILVVPIAAAITLVPLLVAGVPLHYAILVPVPIAALFFGWLPHNDLAYDSTAVWMHIASGMRGVADRVGRLVPVLLIALPVLAIAIALSMAVNGRWVLLPALIGACAALFFTGLGLSSMSSVLAPYAVARPGDSPFQQPQRTGSGSALAQAIVLLGAIALSGPSLWWAWLAISQHSGYAPAALWSGLAIGLVILAVGVVIGAAAFERRGGRLMEFAETT